ncbi:pyridoxamine 5'-phosphate oxidase family protein [Streptomyces sp. NPDC058739]|uniref:pyridoxamine 5'-phosphate oxidase family protein n=1 Tax=Streptomyces sp. NPDC058739 TaxID=3346618 RepID=UPI00367DE81E
MTTKRARTPRGTHSQDLAVPDPEYLAFWRERHLSTLTTLRPDGTPHVVPVGVTYDPGARLARVITDGASSKARNVLAAGPQGAPVAVCQVDGRRWATLEGRAFVHDDPERVAEAVRRYAERYERTPSSNPTRVVIEIELTRALGRG